MSCKRACSLPVYKSNEVSINLRAARNATVVLRLLVLLLSHFKVIPSRSSKMRALSTGVAFIMLSMAVALPHENSLPQIEAGGACNYTGISTECSDDKGFISDCDATITNTYLNASSPLFRRSVCWGHCTLKVTRGIDHFGRPCMATEQDLVDSFHKIRDNGCKGCGEVQAPVGGTCMIRLDYIDDCPTPPARDPWCWAQGYGRCIPGEDT
jgi:hypothetical protein